MNCPGMDFSRFDCNTGPTVIPMLPDSLVLRAWIRIKGLQVPDPRLTKSFDVVAVSCQ
jgi:hypothetical protein